MMLTRRERTPLRKLMLLGAMAGAGALVEATATGNPLMFITDKAKPLKSLLIPFTPVQPGTGDPSPTNVRNIVPWNGLKVWQSGINLWDEEWELGGINGTTGQNSQSENQIRSKNYNPCSPNTQYYVRHPLSGSDMRLCWYKKDKTFISSSWKGMGPTTSPADAYYFRFCMASAYGTTYNNNISINYPSTEMGYNPHTENTETDISFPSPVYGGTLDVVSGVLTVEWAFRTDTGQNEDSWSGTTSGDNRRWVLNKSAFGDLVPKNNAQRATNYFRSASSGAWSAFFGSTGNFLCYVPIEVCEDKEAWLEYLAENPLQICYELAEPYEVQLTGEQITALLGQNTIWSDADGSMTAVFLKKG